MGEIELKLVQSNGDGVKDLWCICTRQYVQYVCIVLCEVQFVYVNVCIALCISVVHCV